MSKIIKPLLNEDGTQVVRELQEGEYYYDTEDYKYIYWDLKSSNAKFAIYYAEEWRPEGGETYFYYHLQKEQTFETKMYNDDTDTYNLKFKNIFQTQAEAEDINNILKVVDNMKKYYEQKLKGAGDEKL